MKRKLQFFFLLAILNLPFIGYSQKELNQHLPVRGFCIAAPTPQNLDSFLTFINQELAPRHVNTLILRVDYHYQYASHPELVDTLALSLTAGAVFAQQPAQVMIKDLPQMPGKTVEVYLIESGPRANVGVMAEALFPGGKVQTQLGQTYRMKPDPLFAAFSGNSGTASDLVGSFSVKFPHLDITDRIAVDRGNGSVRRHEIYVTGTYARSSLQLSYVQLPTSALSLGQRPAGPGSTRLLQAVRSKVPPLGSDRPMDDDLRAVRRLIAEGALDRHGGAEE